MDMDRLAIDNRSTRGRATIDDASPAQSSHHGDRSKVRSETKQIAIDAKDGSIFRVTESRRSLGNRIEHGLKVGRRAGDHPQDVASRRLPFE